VFRWSLTSLTVLAVARVLVDWFEQRQRLRRDALRNPGAFGNYIIVHTNSSLRTHLCLAAVIAIGLLQLALAWTRQSRLARRWWTPPAVELVIFVVFGIVAAQTAGHYAVRCAGSNYSGSCVVSDPYVLHNGWLGVWAVIGIAIGLLWTLAARSTPTKEIDGSQVAAEVSSSRGLSGVPEVPFGHTR